MVAYTSAKKHLHSLRFTIVDLLFVFLLLHAPLVGLQAPLLVILKNKSSCLNSTLLNSIGKVTILLAGWLELVMKIASFS